MDNEFLRGMHSQDKKFSEKFQHMKKQNDISNKEFYKLRKLATSSLYDLERPRPPPIKNLQYSRPHPNKNRCVKKADMGSTLNPRFAVARHRVNSKNSKGSSKLNNSILSQTDNITSSNNNNQTPNSQRESQQAKESELPPLGDNSLW